MESDPEIDTVVLGCTHYPLIEPSIKRLLPDGVKIVSQGDIVAQSLVEYLNRHPEMDRKISKKGSCKYFTTESVEKFISSASVFLKQEIVAEHLDLTK